MTSSLPNGPILTWDQAEDLIAHQEGRPVRHLQTDVASIHAAIGHRLARHGPLDVGDGHGAVIGRLTLDGEGRLQLERLT